MVLPAAPVTAGDVLPLAELGSRQLLLEGFQHLVAVVADLHLGKDM